ncbi:NAD(P)-dependent oxidoreductase [Salinicoccus sp. ID82-1]|uniref:NAD-dependent epimerase/dehydratase family protein n=1 Tax=Salinicoccus sp. ID82-1 TaxID=2820269 RepID=UPI001F412768|nr:NAD(P)-dependent oxidoreductase [Salinicoccus sp. ID82-1]MCG1008822.1 NAD(P)-dependent oxidoreductase [Salinicoccus sp. ID82-1]
MKNILITGASGRIGSNVAEHLKGKYHLTLADIQNESSEDPGDDEMKRISLDITNLQDCREAFRGMDVVIHLAGDPSPEADFESVMRINIEGTYNVFRAAQEAGVERVIFASSVHTVKGYPADVQPHPDMPVRPLNLYGVSKVSGEAFASYFAYQEDLPIIALRIGGYDAVALTDGNLSASDMSIYLSPRDLNHLMEQCITTPMIHPFEVINAVSDNRFKGLDIQKTIERFGYEPMDDAFEKCGYTFDS